MTDLERSTVCIYYGDTKPDKGLEPTEGCKTAQLANTASTEGGAAGDLKSLIMETVWRDFVIWAAGDPGIQAAYREATGRTLLSPPKTPLDAMIDKATGAAEESTAEFVYWVTVNHWGMDEAPARYREAMKTRSPSPSETGGNNE